MVVCVDQRSAQTSNVLARYRVECRLACDLREESSDDLLTNVTRNIPCLTSLETFDVRFPTSLQLDGSDAMNPDPDYSAAYVVIRTDAGDGLEGHGFAFTIGRGNDVQVAAIRALEPFVARPGDRRDARVAGRRLAEARARLAAALARAREGRHAHGDLRGRQRALGPGRQARGQAAVEAAVGPLTGGARRARRLPLPVRRADARGGAGDPPAGRAGRARRASGSCSATAIRPTPRRPAGSATPTPSWRACARRPSPTATPRSS